MNNISKAINGEYSAIYCYEQLAHYAPNSEIKNQILEIRNDEIKHYQVFSFIYTSLTAKEPSPQITEQCPMDFRNGVLAAFKDEQETVDFYHEISGKTSHWFIKEQFQRASADEQNHAVWFLYFLNHH
ncbi:ferritin-like domain-containing protein [Domibacillus epiphyticus]|uniref:Rubrerythrin family protein n=1 Tax=Domibacillus epiphyticus TaxID=1714355 RepID=A0A1V2A857_9BACI|nr:ferritin-like domain-containing protein [Domibacillus epiphyticus]OMP67178.1 rubrerythrin family protein [Domibacillus epiphyticus]